MDKEFLDQFSDLRERLTNNDERFNKQDERFNQLCEKIDNYAGVNKKEKERKDYQFISAIIGSPLAVLIFTWLTSL